MYSALAYERDDGPDFRVGRADCAETRHAGHLDTVFHHPEELSGLAFVRNFLEVRWIGIKASANFCHFTPGAPWQLAQPGSENARSPARITSGLSRSTGL